MCGYIEGYLGYIGYLFIFGDAWSLLLPISSVQFSNSVESDSATP